MIRENRKLFTAKIRKPKQILVSLRAIKNSDNPNLYITEPSKNQIVYQLGKLKGEFHGKGEISLVHVVGYNVTYADGDLDENSNVSTEKIQSDKRSFWMLYSTKRLLSLATSVKLICCDTTFKFLWLGYPAILIGTVDFQKQFHPIAFGFTSIEYSKTFHEAFSVSFFNFLFLIWYIQHYFSWKTKTKLMFFSIIFKQERVSFKNEKFEGFFLFF